MKSILYITFILLNLIYIANTLRCYTCSASETDSDKRCVETPELVEAGSPITNCNKRYCTSQRTEYLDPKDKVKEVFRSCEDNPTNMNEVVEDGTFRIYYKACTVDLCNGGSGKDTTDIVVQNGNQGLGVLYVPGVGKRSASNKFQPISVVFLSASILTLYFI